MTPTYFTNDQHSLPKAIMAYANDAVFKDEFWNVFDKSNDQWELVHIGMARKRGCEETNNISYQTERVTAAFKDGAIDVDIFMDTPMQELTKFKDKNLRIAAASNSQIKLKSKKYYVSEGKKRYLWLATRMGRPTVKDAPGIEVVQTYNLLTHNQILEMGMKKLQ